ncbi:MAG: tyrosine-type recombinase/integrase, partial [Candidatus Kryptoniota bacterium]
MKTSHFKVCNDANFTCPTFLYTFVGHTEDERKSPFKSEGKGIGMRKYLKQDELKALLNAPRRPRDRLILRLLYETGMRVGELAELRIGDIDLENSEITIQQAKRHKEGRKVPLVSDYTKMLVRDYIGTRKNKRDYFLVSNKRTPLSRRQIERLVAKYGAQVGIE